MKVMLKTSMIVWLSVPVVCIDSMTLMWVAGFPMNNASLLNESEHRK